MKKHDFRNAANFARFGNSLRLVSLIGFGLSTITSAAGIAGTVNAAFGFAGWEMYAVWAGAFIASYLVDFRWVKPSLRFFISQLLAFSTRRVRPVMFGGVLLIGACCSALFGLAFSGGTTWVGSTLFAAMASRAVTGTSSETAETFDKVTELTNKGLQPYRDRLIDLETERDRELQNRTSGELQRLSKRGNAWAKGEVEAIRADVGRKYAPQIAAAQKAFDKEKTRLDGVASTVLASVSKRESLDIKTAETTSDTTQYGLQMLGLLGLALGVVVTLLEATGDVSSELPALTDAEIREIEAEKSEGVFGGLTNILGGGANSNPFQTVRGDKAPSQSNGGGLKL
ncbi:MAG: hypothetical protein ACKO0Z_06515 [Betaproteobacteria bacterium]